LELQPYSGLILWRIKTPNLDTSAFDFDEADTITTQKTVKSGSGVDVSVRIVQEITGGNSQQVQTNVAVSTTVKTHIGSVTDDNTSTSVETSTKFECKQEPCKALVSRLGVSVWLLSIFFLSNFYKDKTKMNKSEREINQNSINLPSTTVKTHIGSVTDDNTSTSVETSTKFECKQEPCDDIQCVKSNKSDISHTGSSETEQEEF
jgi:hypothetical protein